MKNLLKLTTVLFAIALTLTACKKDEEETIDKTAPTINIITPANQEAHVSGDMLHLNVEFSDNDELHEIVAYLITTHMSMVDTVKTIHAHPDAATHTMMEHYTIGTVTHTDFSFQVVATDHSGNSSTASTGFHVMQ